jgi:hypothetical protein
MVFCMTAIAFASSLASAADSGNPQALDAVTAPSTLSDFENPNTQLGKASDALTKKITSLWKGISDDLELKLKNKAGSALQKEFNRYRLAKTIGLDNKLLRENGLVAVDGYYQIIVEPNYRDGEQVRRDVYVFGVGVNKALNAVSDKNIAPTIGGKLQLRVTFSRIYTGANAKIEALRQIPYFLNRIPFSANGIKDKMNIGDTFRVEILGNVNGGFSNSPDSTLSSTTSVGMKYTREALFMMDAYRPSSRQARIRMFGLKNRGSFGVSIATSLTPWNSLLSENGGRLQQKIKDLTNVSADLGFTKSADLFHDFPLDTMMLDYLFTFNSDKSEVTGPNSAESAVDEILQNVRRLGFLPLFNIFSADTDLGQSLKKRADISERLAKEDYNKGNNARVRNLFKGRITSNVFTATVGASASSLIAQGRTTITHMRSFVRSEDTFDRKNYYMLESVSNDSEGRAFFGRSERINLGDTDILMKANEQQKVTGLLDIVSTSQIRDKKFDDRELSVSRTALLTSIPKSLQTSIIADFLPPSTQNNAYFLRRFTFGLDAFATLNKLNENEIEKKLYAFLEAHPYKDLMNLPKQFPEFGASLSDYVAKLATLIYHAVGSEYSYDERLAAIHVLIQDSVFQKYLIGEFFSSLLPDDEGRKMVGLTMQFSSEQTPTKNISVGENKVSDVYQFVSFLRSVLNNRSYDLRLETMINKDGTQMLVTPEIKGFSVNLNEDLSDN